MPTCPGARSGVSEGMPFSSDIGYAVLVTKQNGGFELRIRELLITVFAANLSDGWRCLADRKRQVIDLAEAAGLGDQIPPPDPPPPLS
jgi:hypothetical protein